MKYKLKASVITPLTDAGIIDGSGNITLNIPFRTQGQPEKMFTVTWSAATESLQTDNPRAMRAIRNTVAPPTKINGAWKVMDPSIKWFDELPDADASTGKVIGDTDGIRVLSRFERNIIHEYRKTGASVARPQPKDPRPDHADALAAAKSFFGIS